MPWVDLGCGYGLGLSNPHQTHTRRNGLAGYLENSNSTRRSDQSPSSSSVVASYLHRHPLCYVGALKTQQKGESKDPITYFLQMTNIFTANFSPSLLKDASTYLALTPPHCLSPRTKDVGFFFEGTSEGVGVDKKHK